MKSECRRVAMARPKSWLEIPAQIQFLAEPRGPFMQNVRPRARNVSRSFSTTFRRFKLAGDSSRDSLAFLPSLKSARKRNSRELTRGMFFEGLCFEFSFWTCYRYIFILLIRCSWRDMFYPPRLTFSLAVELLLREIVLLFSKCDIVLNASSSII